MNGCMMCGSRDTIKESINAMEAWRLSSQWILDMDEWTECFSNGRDNKELALKYSRNHFKNKYPGYVERTRNGAVSDKHKKEMFNIFYEAV